MFEVYIYECFCTDDICKISFLKVSVAQAAIDKFYFQNIFSSKAKAQKKKTTIFEVVSC